MKMIQLCLAVISIIISPPFSEADPNVTTVAHKTSSSADAVLPSPVNPTDVLCDVLRPNTCAPTFACLNGKCSCPGNMIYSLSSRACKIRAGGLGCQKSGDCTDFGCCFHPRRRFHHHYPYGPYHVHHYEHYEATQCHCKLGPVEGINGVCEPADPNERCSGIVVVSNPIVLILTTSCLCRILNP